MSFERYVTRFIYCVKSTDCGPRNNFQIKNLEKKITVAVRR